MNNLTVLYYSANSEDAKFEARIKENLLANIGELPLISVTQEPAPGFGKNICVGEHHNCYGNEFRQIQVGLKEVKTNYVITAEADVLYPPEYFQFQPKNGNYYRYGNVWVYFFRRKRPWNKWAQGRAFFKQYSDGAQIMRKDFWLGLIAKEIGDKDEWFTEESKPQRFYQPKTNPAFVWTSENPVITFKTYNNVSRNTSFRGGRTKSVEVLPHWGNVDSLSKKMFS